MASSAFTKFGCYFLTVAVLSGGCAHKVFAAQSSTAMRGTIGAYSVGLNYTVEDETKLVAAHYYYASHLKDIALEGSVDGESIELKGGDGSVFHLHFVGNGSNGEKPLGFNNSIGMNGTWTIGSRTLDVTLKSSHSTANPGQRLYEQVTTQSDAEFEAMVQSARAEFLAGNRDNASKFIHFPLIVHLRDRSLTIHSARELQRNWSTIFTTRLIAKLKQSIPHEMFVHQGRVMLGDGELWFDDKGLIAANVP